MKLEIFVDPRHPTRYEVETESTGLRHFALQISNPLEMEWLKNASDEVIDFELIMEDWHGIRFVFMKDPDGTVIELYE